METRFCIIVIYVFGYSLIDSGGKGGESVSCTLGKDLGENWIVLPWNSHHPPLVGDVDLENNKQRTAQEGLNVKQQCRADRNPLCCVHHSVFILDCFHPSPPPGNHKHPAVAGTLGSSARSGLRTAFGGNSSALAEITAETSPDSCSARISRWQW